MSESVPPSEELIRRRINTCGDLLADTIEPHIEPESEDCVYKKIDGYFGNIENYTLNCITDRFETSSIYANLKLFLRGIAVERGYHEKLERNVGSTEKTEDNIVKTYRWFKMYTTVMLDENPDVENEAAIENLKNYRDEQIDHPKELPSPENTIDPVLLSSLVLIWNLIEEIIKRWDRVIKLDEEVYERKIELLEDDSIYIGFVREVEHDRCYVTAYSEGEGGDSIGAKIGESQINYFPSEGDIVMVEDTTEIETRNNDTLIIPTQDGKMKPYG